MRSPVQLRSRQKGAVAIVLGLSLVTLFAMGGVVLDLGHLYVAKSELQNAADAAALAGAKELNEKTAGITLAVSQAQAIAQKNKYNFSTDVVLAAADIEFGPGPDGPWSTVAAAQSSPQGKTFIKVDTGLKSMNTYLMRVAGPAFNTVSTLGVAVAGRYVNDITPIGVCAVDPVNRTEKYTYPTGLTELVEFGFRRGVTYDIFSLNPLGGGPSDPYLINPVDAPPTACNPAHSSANFTAPFLCGGNSAIISSGVGQVYTNTGLSANLAESLNSRFGSYQPAGRCIAASAPPDVNVKEYPFATSPTTDWMDPAGSTLPGRQSVALDTNPLNINKPKYRLPTAGLSPGPTPVPDASATYAQFPNYGVLWSYGPAYQANGNTPPNAGTAFTPQQANGNPMYNASAIDYFDTTNATKYPLTAGTGFPAGTPAAPYNQTSGPYFQSGGPAGVRNRRILNLVLVDCRVPPVGSASCGRMTAVGVGKFFMQTKANFSSSARLDLEFTGLIEPVPTSEIKLYR